MPRGVPRRIQLLVLAHPNPDRSERATAVQAHQAADPEAGPSCYLGTSVDIDSEKEEKFLKIILEKADRIGGSPRFCKRRWLLQPSRGELLLRSICSCAQFASDHT